MKYTFLAITYFCSSVFAEEEINDLKRLYMCCFVLFVREVTVHKWNQLWNLVLQGIRKRENGKKYLLVESNSCEIPVIILRYMRYINLLFKKDFKIAELPYETSFFLYFRDRPKIAREINRGDVENIMCKSN